MLGLRLGRGLDLVSEERSVCRKRHLRQINNNKLLPQTCVLHMSYVMLFCQCELILTSLIVYSSASKPV